MVKMINIAFAIIMIMLIFAASLLGYFYAENNNLKRQSELARLSKMEVAAEDIYYYRLWSYASFYGTYMQNVRQYSNDSNVVIAGGRLLEYYSQIVVYAIQDDLRTLMALDVAKSRAIYENVSDTLDHALDSIRLAVNGRDSNESLSLLWDLYYIFGVDQWSRSENLTGLGGLDWAFMELSSYWHYGSIYYGFMDTMPLDQPNLNLILDWILGNSTALHGALTEWYSHLS